MAQEVRVLAEGTMRWVQASGRGTSWATAATPKSGLLGYVQPGAQFTIGREYAFIEDRGKQDHAKLVRTSPVPGSFTLLEGVTADWPEYVIATASGATVPMVHLEFKQAAPEGTPIYYQLMGVPWPGSIQLTEQAEGNTRAYTFQALTALGPTASGYLG